VVHEYTFDKSNWVSEGGRLVGEIDPNDETPVICSSGTKPYSLSGMSKLIKTIRIRADVPVLSHH
jgi:hypothetical protein